jgi:hypothetical protein
MWRAVLVALCFGKENSHPPICGIHNVALVQSQLPIDRYAPHLGHITSYVCPVSGQVVKEAATR